MLEAIHQSLGHPLTDGTILNTGLTPYLADQTLGQLDREDLFEFRESSWSGLMLSSANVACGLAWGNAKPEGQTCDDLGRGLLLLQQLNGLVHAPVILDYGGAAQYDITIIPYETLSTFYSLLWAGSKRRTNGLR